MGRRQGPIELWYLVWWCVCVYAAEEQILRIDMMGRFVSVNIRYDKHTELRGYRDQIRQYVTGRNFSDLTGPATTILSLQLERHLESQGVDLLDIDTDLEHIVASKASAAQSPPPALLEAAGLPRGEPVMEFSKALQSVLEDLSVTLLPGMFLHVGTGTGDCGANFLSIQTSKQWEASQYLFLKELDPKAISLVLIDISYNLCVLDRTIWEGVMERLVPGSIILHWQITAGHPDSLSCNPPSIVSEEFPFTFHELLRGELRPFCFHLNPRKPMTAQLVAHQVSSRSLYHHSVQSGFLSLSTLPGALNLPALDSMIFVWVPLVTKYRVGGLKALEDLYFALRQRGYSVRPFHDLDDLSVFEEARPGDLLVLSEIMEATSLRAFGCERGMRVIRWLLALHPGPREFLTAPTGLARLGAVVIPSSHFTQTVLPFSTTSSILFSPLDSVHYEAFEDRGPVLWKRNLVVWDDDHISGSVTVDDLDLPDHIEVFDLSKVKNLHPYAVMLPLLQSSKVVVDLYIPGAERLVFEGVLAGALPIISNREHGVDPYDFPMPQEFKVDPTNATQVRNAILSLIDDYDRHRVDYAYFEYTTLMLPSNFHTSIDHIFGSFQLYFTIDLATLPAHYSIFPLLASIIFLYPLANIHVHTSAPLDPFLSRWSEALSVLELHGYTNASTGGAYHAIHFSEKADVNKQQPRSTLHFHIDPSILLLDRKAFDEAIFLTRKCACPVTLWAAGVGKIGKLTGPGTTCSAAGEQALAVDGSVMIAQVGGENEPLRFKYGGGKHETTAKQRFQRLKQWAGFQMISGKARL